MKEYQALIYNDKTIVLNNSKTLAELYDTMMVEENFILSWKEKDKKYSDVIIASNIVAKVKTGDIKLSANEV